MRSRWAESAVQWSHSPGQLPGGEGGLAASKPIVVVRRAGDRLALRMVYPRSLFDAAGADAFLRGLMDATLAEAARAE